MISQEEGIPKGLNILAVDDDRSILKVYECLLEDGEHHVVMVSSGREAIAQIENNRFDLIFMDLVLPDMKGEEILRQVGQKIEWIPVVIVTANPSLESSIDLIKIGGVYDYVIKPFGSNELKIAIVRAMEKVKLAVQNRRLLNKLEVANTALTERVSQLETCANVASQYEKEAVLLRDEVLRLREKLKSAGME